MVKKEPKETKDSKEQKGTKGNNKQPEETEETQNKSLDDQRFNDLAADIPAPVTEGPVEPPKPPKSKWVYIIGGVILLLAVIGFVLFHQQKGESQPETSATAQTEVQEEKVLSYLSVVDPVDLADHYAGTEDECWYYEGYDVNDRATNLARKAPNVERPAKVDGKVNFTLGAHIEPHKQYNNVDYFMRQLERMNKMVELANKHKIKMSIQIQPPFSEMAQKLNVDDIANWAADGHQIAIHFHENAQLKAGGIEETNSVPYGVWLSTMHDLQTQIEDLCDCHVNGWSGGNLYNRILDVGEELAMTATFNYKDPLTQLSDPDLAVVNPWTPDLSGSVAALKTFDPIGSVVYIPGGVYPFHCQKAEGVPRPYTEAGFSFVTKALYETMKEASSGKVNVFNMTFHPGDFGAPADDDAEFDAWDRWMSDVIDRERISGRLVSKTYSEIAEDYFKWLKKQEGKITPMYLSEEEVAELEGG